MSQRLLITNSDVHDTWLEATRIEKGMRSKQEVVRELITQAYLKSKEAKRNE